MTELSMDVAIERVRQSVARRRMQLELDRRQRLATDTLAATRHTPGARVFDPVTGQEGEVVHAASENVVVPNAQR